METQHEENIRITQAVGMISKAYGYSDYKDSEMHIECLFFIYLAVHITTKVI